MNRHDFAKAADELGIRRSAYSLSGGEPPEQYVLELTEGGWVVYYSERGLRRDETFFDTEAEACDQLLLWLVEDPTTQRPEHEEGGEPRIG